ncbi:alpha/beta fold hydrolase [Streptomyces sp. NPDC086549]|uniref:alpha/beta fold hydrolase n=1 Tax=Streptomyces sp. NPDC086549 TaxID=3365752 RepID=UPI00383008F2
MKTERIGHSDVRFRRHGEGELAAVFVHGFLDDQYVWDDMISVLTTSGLEWVTLELAGCGDRTEASGPFDYDRFAAEVGSVTAALGKDFVMVGQSMGAAVAELVAAGQPERAAGLVLLNPVPLAGTLLPDEVIDRFRSLGGDPAAQRAVRTQLSPSWPEAELDRLVVSGARIRAEVVRDFADCWNTGHPAGRRHSGFEGPTLVVRGDDDGFVTEELLGQHVTPRFRSVHSVSVGEAGHWVHIEQPARVAGHIDDFLTGVFPSGRGTASETLPAQGWTNAFAARSSDAFGEAFAADVVLEASALTRPVKGRDQVKQVMGTASAIYESLAFTQEAVQGHRTYLEWEATAFGGVRLEGVTILTRDESGRIVRAAIHHRPLDAVKRFSSELRERLRGEVEAELFHQG